MAAVRLDATPDFFEQNYDRIYRYVRGMVRDPDEAEDLTQEAFLRAHSERESLRDAGAIVAWLYRIATHVTLDRLRQRKATATHVSTADPAELEQQSLVALTAEQGLEQGQMSDCVQRYLIELPDTYRAVILLHDAHGLTGPEIAALLEVSLPTVKIRLHRARGRLKQALQEGCRFSCDSRGVLVCEPRR
jgi:RNA polymerase sigma-70 factor, ECF subfamily